MQSCLFKKNAQNACFCNHGWLKQDQNLKAVVPIQRPPDSAHFFLAFCQGHACSLALLVFLLLCLLLPPTARQLQLMLPPVLWGLDPVQSLGTVSTDSIIAKQRLIFSFPPIYSQWQLSHMPVRPRTHPGIKYMLLI